MPIDFTITSSGDPQTKGTTWFATPSDGSKTLTVGSTRTYSDGDGPHRGLDQMKILSKIPRLYYDRDLASKTIGLWAHYMWPTIVAESAGGHHLLVNTYDRARFTFGFYQLAAHTPDDNLVLLFRELLQLPSAKDYFPDLALVGGKVHALVAGKQVPLETVTAVHRPNGKVEDQLVGFMSYLNPDTHNAGEAEVRNTARLMHWLLNDPAAIAASAKIAVGIARRKARHLAAKYDLSKYPVEAAIWVSDIVHQARGTESVIRAALAVTDADARLNALYHIGESETDYDGRRETVRKCIAVLTGEQRFKGVTIGSTKLPF